MKLEKCFLAIVIRYNQNFQVNEKFGFINKKCYDVMLMIKVNPLNISQDISSIFKAEKLIRNIEFQKELKLFPQIETIRIDENLLIMFKKYIQNKFKQIIITSSTIPSLLSEIENKIIELTINNNFQLFNLNKFIKLIKIKIICNDINEEVITTLNNIKTLKFISIYYYKIVNNNIINIISKCKINKIILYCFQIDSIILNKLTLPKHTNEIIFCNSQYIVGMDPNIYVSYFGNYEIVFPETIIDISNFINTYLPSNIILKSFCNIFNNKHVYIDFSSYNHFKSIRNDISWLSVIYPNSIYYVGDISIPQVNVSKLIMNHSHYIGKIPNSVTWLSLNNSNVTFSNPPKLQYLCTFFSKMNYDINILTTLTKIHSVGDYTNFSKLTNLKELTTNGFINTALIQFPSSLTKLKLECTPSLYCSPFIKKLVITSSQEFPCKLSQYTQLVNLKLDGCFTFIELPTTLTSLKFNSLQYNNIIDLSSVLITTIHIVNSGNLFIILPQCLKEIKLEKSSVSFMNTQNICLNEFSMYDCDWVEIDNPFHSILKQNIFMKTNKPIIYMDCNTDKLFTENSISSNESEEHFNTSDSYGSISFENETSEIYRDE
ncbi:hypothetical protein EHI8A_001120 [Entamoeba histolytica HM-1:IMSS-B]|uniref:Leucine-rich repeat containing protein n=5 Tax=Entamoeba histolytica TaxID=5759 RepID=C4M0J6_ENTH1|nr:hypothetical protein EHI_024540 [Entamoeba histolytica HM-1:IMSS]EMD46253.1 Hypothetical protein EHI5A_011210 [Entamoeba histolytica KU27]EMH73964.1 hypothetical protein EHI8A_001120 [Entamoeba histolytica HM-1:IMSS-B]EMS11672.1 hypothetical protein KM1_011460 [Entamoeba histolytica HM-3:IMSS]ENY65373.1 hypothetical protein EHI7A_002550 [Entamoeba histolytica HM-1:IMSS-A]EAL46897.1 hypothetical protein EHI_024540 [Entamoeba histolytica HM-1:IMSS]|eukprot:XP_652283.1 hypothetical protein EHI_024540 [Entamoeba histolytica HM-1:IMSS]